MSSYRASHRRAYLTRWVLTVVLLLVAVATRSVVIAVAALAGFAGAEWTVRRRLRKYRRGSREVTITITQDGYHTQGPDTATFRTWSDFTSVTQVGQFWVLRLASTGALAFPADVLSEDETVRFTSLLRRHGLTQPGNA